MTWDDFPNNCNSKTLDSINANLHNISNVPGNTFNIALSSIFTAFNFDESCSVILFNVFKLQFLSCRHWQAALFYDDVDRQLSTSKTAALFITPKMSNILCKLWYLKSFKKKYLKMRLDVTGKTDMQPSEKSQNFSFLSILISLFIHNSKLFCKC